MLTPKQKSDKKAKDNLQMIHARILNAWSFGQIKSWYDVFTHLGQPNIDEKMKLTKPTYPELNSYLNKQKEELEIKLKSGEIKQVGDEREIGISYKYRKVEADNKLVSDSSDCTVYALANVTGLSYTDCHSLLEKAGRLNGHGFNPDKLLSELGFNKSKLYHIPLVDFITHNPLGKFYVYTGQHAFAIIDGIVIDVINPIHPMTILRSIWQLNRLTLPKPPEPPKEYIASNNYGWVATSRTHDKDLYSFWFQKKASAELYDKVISGVYDPLTNKKVPCSGLQLVAATGLGKTYIIYDLMDHFLDIKYDTEKTFSHIPYLVLTKATIIEQHTRVARRFGINAYHCEITNIEALRSKEGQQWIKEETIVEDGKEKIINKWKNRIQPCVVFFDESQGARRKEAQQTQKIYAYNDLPKENACLIGVSATPFMRVTEAKAFAVSTHRPLDHLGFPAGTFLTNETWPAYSAIISAPGKPADYNRASVKRLMDDLDAWVVRVKGVIPQFRASNAVKYVNFLNLEQKRFYDSAQERYLEEKAKLDAAKDAGEEIAQICYLVIRLKYAMAAEFCHAPSFVKGGYYDVMEMNKASVFAVKFKQTSIEIVLLLQKMGIKRDQISMIWGGGQTALTKKQKSKAKIKEKAAKLKELGIDVDEFLGDVGLDEVEDRVIKEYPPELRLGLQSQEERQREIDKFQSGQTLFCIYTLKAGGVGLSLHHCDELTKEKVRRKENGYAYEEDIINIPVRQRKTRCCVTDNAIELVQALGRVPRLTSLSNTEQDIECFNNTVEVDIGRVIDRKLPCLSEVVRHKEDWSDLRFAGTNRQALVEAAIKLSEDYEKDESGLIDEGEIDNDDEEENGD